MNVLGAGAQRASADEVNFNFFYQSLDPYGEWLSTNEYGYCWRPAQVDSEWAPYTDGYWSYTDAGWTWVGYEDWADICYHYGRWVNLEEAGWCWVPDSEWAPAWVSWRNNDTHVGWAPLPPEAKFRREVGVSVWADTTYDLGPGSYNFCAVEDFGSPVIREVIIPRRQNVLFITQTYNITNICYRPSTRFIFCGGPDFGQVSSRSHHPVPSLKLVQNTNITNITNINITNNNGGEARQPGVFKSSQRGNTLQVVAPVVKLPTPLTKAQPASFKTLPESRADRGWGQVAATKQEDVKATLREQTNGATPARTHAKPVTEAQLKHVPATADLTAKPASKPIGGLPVPTASGLRKPTTPPPSNLDGPAVTSREMPEPSRRTIPEQTTAVAPIKQITPTKPRTMPREPGSTTAAEPTSPRSPGGLSPFTPADQNKPGNSQTPERSSTIGGNIPRPKNSTTTRPTMTGSESPSISPDAPTRRFQPVGSGDTPPPVRSTPSSSSKFQPEGSPRSIPSSTLPRSIEPDRAPSPRTTPSSSSKFQPESSPRGIPSSTLPRSIEPDRVPSPRTTPSSSSRFQPESSPRSIPSSTPSRSAEMERPPSVRTTTPSAPRIPVDVPSRPAPSRAPEIPRSMPPPSIPSAPTARPAAPSSGLPAPSNTNKKKDKEP